MKIFRGFRHPGIAPACALTIGNFDGVHRGHQAMLALLNGEAAQRGVQSCALTFEPHPRAFFAQAAGKDQPAFRLMNAQARAHRFEMLGVEYLFELPFDATLAAMSAEDFARDVLAAGLGVAHVTVGADFRFGAGRKGGAEDLEQIGRAHV